MRNLHLPSSSVSNPHTYSDKKDQEIYEQLLALSPGMEERLNNGTEQEIFYVAEMVRLFPPFVPTASGIQCSFVSLTIDYQGVVDRPIR